MIEKNSDLPIRGDVAKGEPMTHRLRVEAPGNPKEARFLHVLQGADVGALADPTRLIESSGGTAFSGAMVATTAILFPVALDAPFNGTTYTVSTEATTHLITGLSPNGRYTVAKVVAGATETVTVSSGGNEIADSGGVLSILKGTVPAQTVFVSSNGHRFHLRITAPLGQVVRIETSVDLGRWNSLGIAQPTASGSLEFTEAAANDSTAHFYRAVSP